MVKNILLHSTTGQEIYPIIDGADQVYHGSLPLSEAKNAIKKQIISAVYPIGSVIIFENDIDPNDSIEGTTWVPFAEGKILVGSGYLDPADTTSTYIHPNSSNAPTGEYSVAITTETMPSHSHRLYRAAYSGGDQGYDYSGSGNQGYTWWTGGGGSHSNLMPYKTVCIWRRTA